MLQAAYSDYQIGAFEHFHQLVEDTLIVLRPGPKVFFQYELRFANRLKSQLLISHLFLPIKRMLPGQKKEREIKPLLENIPAFLNYPINFCFNVEALSARSRRLPSSTPLQKSTHMGVDCGKPDENSLMADKPSLLVEVLSPTTGGFDLTVKLAEYQDLPSLDFILFVDTESPTVHLYRRDAARRWQDAVLKGLDAVVELENLKISVPLRDIYEGLQFRPKPKLVQSSQEDAEPDGGFKPT